MRVWQSLRADHQLQNGSDVDITLQRNLEIDD